MSEVSSNQKNTNNAATNTGEAPRERGFVRPSRPMAPPKRGAVKKKIWEDFTGKPSSSNPPTELNSEEAWRRIHRLRKGYNGLYYPESIQYKITTSKSYKF
ncbi:hypothetical protein POTOM_007696 [Populus tomentosa]|uniref:Uncharacterized protein n=1 Tax=Populus tomentosa TaxID=118781 RepID=A0A8X8AG39_POPTO|nr:hypothetical protein POTOM_007696 [Populus tomentosa]